MSMLDEVRYRLRLPLDAYAAIRFTVCDYFTRDQEVGHGLMTVQTDPRFYYHRGPWWVSIVENLLDTVDVMTGHQFCSTNLAAHDWIVNRYTTTHLIPIDPVDVRHWREFIGGPDDEEVEFGPHAPFDNVVANDPVWLDVLGPHWFCTGCGVLVGRRRPEDHGVCIDCGTAMLPRGHDVDLGWSGDPELEPTTYYCDKHERHLPCRPCMRERREQAGQ